MNRLPINDRTARWLVDVAGTNSAARKERSATMPLNEANVAVNRAEFARHSPRIAVRRVSATASSTGWISVGELAMTPKISLVAVCCSL